jgi:hypothetical protein
MENGVKGKEPIQGGYNNKNNQNKSAESSLGQLAESSLGQLYDKAEQ